MVEPADRRKLKKNPPRIKLSGCLFDGSRITTCQGEGEFLFSRGAGGTQRISEVFYKHGIQVNVKIITIWSIF